MMIPISEESDEISDISTNLSTYMKEMEQKWILGTSDVDKDWDTYIKTINDMGYATIEKVYNNVYQRQLELLKK